MINSETQNIRIQRDKWINIFENMSDNVLEDLIEHLKGLPAFLRDEFIGLNEILIIAENTMKLREYQK